MLNAVFAIPVLNLISRVYLAYHATQISEILHSPVVFYVICIGDGCLEILITLVVPRLFIFHTILHLQLSRLSVDAKNCVIKNWLL